MARLPSAYDLQRRPATAATPDVRVGKIDYSPMDEAAKAMGAAIGGTKDRPGIAGAIRAYADAEDKTKQHELDRQLLDFKLDTEMEYEQYKRSMPPGAEGYGNAWADQYRERAKGFVGENYSRIPEALRPHVDKILQSQDVMLRERALRDEFAERDRNTVAALEQTLGKTKSAVEANPDRLRELHAEGDQLIQGSMLPPTLKSQFGKKYRTEMEEAAALSIVDGVKDAASYNRAKEMLAPHKAERVTARDVRASITSGASKGGAAGWAASNPTWRGLDPYQKAALMSLMEADGANGEDAKNALGAMINRAAKGGEDLGAHVSRKIYQPTIEPAQERRIEKLMKSPKFAELTEWAKRRAAGEEADPVNGATHFLASERTMLALEAREPSKYKSWRQWTNFDAASGSYRGVITRDGSHAFLAPEGTAEGTGQAPAEQPDAYDGPFQNLRLEKRRAFFAKAEANLDRVKKGVESAIKSYEEGALNGRLPGNDELNTLERTIRDIDDPMLAAKYTSLLAKAEFSDNFGKMPPWARTELIRRLEGQAAVASNKEIEDRLQFANKQDKALTKQQNEDPVGWAGTKRIELPMGVSEGQSFEQAEASAMGATTAINVQPTFRPIELERIDFSAKDIEARLDLRMDQAKAIGGYLKQGVLVFTAKERDYLKDQLKLGGPSMLGTMGHIAAAAERKGLDASAVMREFTKDAPEVAVIGQMVAANGDKNLLTTAANALAWKTKLGEKFESTIDKAQAKPDLDEYRDVLSTTPTNVDAVKHTANLIYEYEARRQGLKDFNETVYKGIVGRVMGKTTINGVEYGGVGHQGTGWNDGKWSSGGWFGKTTKVLMPPEVRSDSFDDMVGAIQARDLPQPPVDSAGKPLTIGQIRQASWVSLGPGKYALELKRDDDGTRVVAMDAAGKPYVLDVRPMLPAIQKRKPEIFMGSQTR